MYMCMVDFNEKTCNVYMEKAELIFSERPEDT
jgi:hypothetical protein